MTKKESKSRTSVLPPPANGDVAPGGGELLLVSSAVANVPRIVATGELTAPRDTAAASAAAAASALPLALIEVPSRERRVEGLKPSTPPFVCVCVCVCRGGGDGYKAVMK